MKKPPPSGNIAKPSAVNRRHSGAAGFQALDPNGLEEIVHSVPPSSMPMSLQEIVFQVFLIDDEHGRRMAGIDQPGRNIFGMFNRLAVLHLDGVCGVKWTRKNRQRQEHHVPPEYPSSE